ncbi:hypothetical protein [Dyella sp. 2HG41-7]|uniref:hypothetical protein n=1 Tax=Dyella sp. 2HG41-7 TaxID=2883239 RepID=UPI001F262D2D|nr:hypothetical protein [Dyella sp. 2HG41-7]
MSIRTSITALALTLVSLSVCATPSREGVSNQASDTLALIQQVRASHPKGNFTDIDHPVSKSYAWGQVNFVGLKRMGNTQSLAVQTAYLPAGAACIHYVQAISAAAPVTDAFVTDPTSRFGTGVRVFSNGHLDPVLLDRACRKPSSPVFIDFDIS